METRKYRVVFEGDIKEGNDIENVKFNMAIIYNQSIEKIESAFFTGKRAVVKKNVSLETARGIQKEFEKSGAICFIEEEEKEFIPNSFGNESEHNIGRRQKGESRSEEVLAAYRMLTGKIELSPNAIHYKGKHYPYTSIVHLGRFARKTSLYFIPVTNFLRIRIFVEHMDKPIIIQTCNVFTGSLKNVYERLAEKTFEARSERYLNQLTTNGFFDYGGARFFPPNEVLIKGQRLNLQTTKVSWVPFELVVKGPGFLARKRRINTELDQDIFFPMLEKFYGISFR